ncbi:anoctamin-6 isoform X2 [Drosophila sulfurigaster albostrigata]|nr:anoctamin-6 isoform X2 [Drosophila sulfurigaster albostrigata]XP_062141321.1 anoctamin-6 isoform X2 [Drosophila sulfurigaster albostrigata]XP_062141322.1 anoctamin-6 isoform X2 [Drosophila sulfurigaster albostrigata]
MDERESLYFDTISLAESEAAAAAAHRKSLSQSRNTIYHSAVDLAGDESRNSLRLASGSAAEHMRLAWQPGYRQSTALEHLNGGADHTDAAIAAQVLALQNGRTHLPTGIGVGGGGGGGGMSGGGGHYGHGATAGGGDDEVSRRLLRQSSTVSNKDKKLPITYSQWKLRTYRRFNDGKRSVDFVLAYNGEDLDEEAANKRKIFEANLMREGIELEYYKEQWVHFIKLHAPPDVLHRYAEVLKIKMPLKPIPGQEQIIAETTLELKSWFTRMCRSLFSSVQLNTDVFPDREQRIHMEFAQKYLELYDKEHPNYFDPSTRYSIINFVMQRQHFEQGEEKADNLGIEKLVEDGVYLCAYTLHDKDRRGELLKEWASIRKWKNLQPLDYVKDYFGAKVALYFAWLGFYTHMLMPVSVLGIFFFLYGFVTWSSDPISQDICNDNDTIMCPQCDKGCNFWRLNETCTSSKFNYLIDNKMTVVFAFVMAIWSVIYLELWKRYSAGLVHRWGLTGFNHHVEHPRPQYLAKVSQSKRLSKKLGEAKTLDPDVPFWSIKFWPNFTSYSIMVLFICISVIAISAIIIYRMAQRASHSILANENTMTYKIMVLPITAGFLDLIVISILDLVYSSLAVRLTNYEYCRTQTEYDESLTIKNYVFQFVNYYSSLFYIAFFKGKFVGYPSKYNRIFSFRQEECNPGGCLMELCVQLVIIMVGKQAVNAIVEMLIPYLMRTAKELNQNYGWFKRHSEQKLVPSTNQFTEDFNLLPAENNSLYAEYLEMVIQYGFITLFSLAFPLAPLLALINNVIELRLDAIKMLRFVRRPVGMRARDIGVWHSIMTVLTHIAVASSAMIIAFSTNFIPKLVYKATHDDPELNGYLNFTMAAFYTKDFETDTLLNVSATANVTECYYTEFRNNAWEPNPYKRPVVYWKILTARLAFIVIYQNIITMLQGILRWAVPDVSGRLLKRIKRENFLLREHIIEFEKRQAQELTQTKLQSQQQQQQQQQQQTVGSEPEDLLRQRLNGNNNNNSNNKNAAGDSSTTYV